MRLGCVDLILKKFISLDIPYRYYYLSYIDLFGILALFAVLIGALIMLIAIILNYPGDKTILSSIISAFIVLGLLVIWFIGNKLFVIEDNLFLSPEDYFNQYEKELINNIKVENFKTYLENFKEFISSEKNILVIHSFAGYGKSHLLREFSLNKNELDTERVFLFAKPNFSNISLDNAFKEQLKRNEKYSIFFDNVDVDDVKKIVSWTKNKDSLKVVFSLRESNLNYLLKKIDTKYDQIKINWTETDLIYFLREVIGYSTVKDQELVTYYNNPKLISLKSEAINDSNFDFEKLEIIVSDLDKDAKFCLYDFNYTFREKEKLLINLACIVPFSKTDEFWEILQNQTGFEIDEIKDMTNNLINGGILLEKNDLIHFNSDIVGYVYLYYKLIHREYVISSVESLINSKKEIWDYLPNNIYNNLGNAISIANILLQDVTTVDIPKLHIFFSNIINKWIDEEDKTFGTIRAQNLSYLEFFAQIVPDRTLDLLNTYIDSNPPSSTDCLLNQDIKMDDFGPVLIKLFEIPTIEKEILDFMEKMEETGLKTTYSNYEVCDLLKQFVSPYRELNTQQILNVLNIFDDYLNSLTHTKIQLISCALDEIFTVSKYDLIGQFKLKRVKLELKDTSETRNIRNISLKILKGLINHDSVDAKLSGIKISKNLGSSVSKEDDNLSDILTKERKELVAEIGDLIKSGINFNLLTEIEDLFLRWWATQAQGTEDVEIYLSNGEFPRDMEYIVSKYFISEKYVIQDFDKLKNNSPTNDLWKWYVEQKYENLLDYHNMDYYIGIVEDLDKKYGNINDLVTFLKIVDENISGFEFNYNTPLIKCWVGKNQDLFLELKDSQFWSNIPERFKLGIESALTEIDDVHLHRMADNLLNDPKNVNLTKLNSFLIAIGKNAIETSQVKTWLNKIIEDGSNNQRILVMSRLRFIFADDVDSIAEILYTIISKEPKLNSRIINESWLIMTSLNENIDKINPDTQKNLRKDLFEKLIELKDLNDEFDEIMDFVFTNMDECFDFIEKRIEHFINNRGISYNPIPYDGIGYIKNNINSYDEFEGFMDKFIIIYNDNLDWHIFLDDLMSDIKHIPLDEDECYLQKYIEKQIQELNIDSAILSLKFLSLRIKNYKIFLQLCELGISSGKYEDIKIILLNNSENDDLIKKMYDESRPGKLRGLLNSLISN